LIAVISKTSGAVKNLKLLEFWHNKKALLNLGSEKNVPLNVIPYLVWSALNTASI